MASTTQTVATEKDRGATAPVASQELKFWTLDMLKPPGLGRESAHITVTATEGQAGVLRATLDGSYQGGLLSRWSLVECRVDRDFTGALAFIDGFTSVRGYRGVGGGE